MRSILSLMHGHNIPSPQSTYFDDMSIFSEYQGDMLFADYARGCVLRFKGDGNNFDFSQPHVVMDGRFVGQTYMNVHVS